MEYRSLYLIEQLLAAHAPALAFDRTPLTPTPEEVEARRHFPNDELREFAGFFYDRRRDDDPLVKTVTQRCRENYRALVRGAKGTPVLFLVQPTFWHLTEKEWTGSLRHHQLDPAAHERGLAQRRLLAVGKELDLPMHDLTPRFASWPNEELWLPTDRHLSAKGCDQVAQWILPEVRRLLGH